MNEKIETSQKPELDPLEEFWIYLDEIEDLTTVYTNLVKEITENPDDSLPLKKLNDLGGFFIAHGEINEAIHCFEKIVENGGKKKSPRSLANLGHVFLKAKKDYKKAEKIFKELVEIVPDNPKYWHTLGFCLAGQGKWQEAKKYLKKALELAPDSIGSLHALGSCSAKQILGSDEKKKEEYGQEAKEYYNKIIALEPENKEAYNALSFVFLLERNYEEAKKFSSKAVELDPENLRFLGVLKDSLEMLKEYAELEKVSQKVLKLYFEKLNNAGSYEEKLSLQRTITNLSKRIEKTIEELQKQESIDNK